MHEQRYLPALRTHIDKMLGNGWVIVRRAPLTLRLGRRTCLVKHDMLISEYGLGSSPADELPDCASNAPQDSARPLAVAG